MLQTNYKLHMMFVQPRGKANALSTSSLCVSVNMKIRIIDTFHFFSFGLFLLANFSLGGGLFCLALTANASSSKLTLLVI